MFPSRISRCVAGFPYVMAMKPTKLELLDSSSNAAVVTLPGRAFPGVVIQGDSLSVLARAALRVREELRSRGAGEDAIETCTLLTAGLGGRLLRYQQVLAERGISLPYAEPLSPEEVPAEPRDAFEPDEVDLTTLRSELEAEEGSFLLALRCDLRWDEDAFERLTKAMQTYVRARDEEADIPRWIAEGFWFLDWFVKQWSTHPSFPRTRDQAHYDAAYECLHDLAFRLFVRESVFMNGGEPAPR